ncbi:MAG: pilus assembly protein PilM [Planctomycetes bacterium]|jgi:type IV pilus assembly protein PilM|nr:pilus assembly protein PilM [Planctomycetota bacterium]
MAALNWITANHRIQPIGLDIGHSGLKMVQLAVRDDRLKVLAARKLPLELDPAGDAQEHRRVLVPALRRLLAEGQFHGHGVVSALPMGKVRITSLRLPEAEADEADRLLRREAATRFDLDPAHAIVHHLLAGSVRQGDEVKNEYILLAVDHETIAAHLQLLEEADLTPTAIDAPPCALFRTFERTMRRQEDRERTAIFIDVGYRYTTVVFGRSGEICFVKQIAVGMEQFNDQVAAALGIAAPEAESFRLRLQRDDAIDADTRRHIVDALHVTSEQLAGEISLCLRYYTVTFRGKRVERAVVAGGGAYEQILRDILRRHLSVEIEVAEPLRGFDCRSDQTGEEAGVGHADLALAVGLSLKGCPVLPRMEREARRRPEPVVEDVAP